MGAHWTLSLDDTFVEAELDGQTGFVRDDQAVIMAPFETEVSADDAIDQMELATEGALAHLTRSGDSVRREAVILERDGKDESRFALQGFVAVDGALLAIGLYWDKPEDRVWAEETFAAIGVE